MNSRQALPQRAALLIFAVLACIFAAGPIVWGVATALKPAAEVISYPPRLLPSTISLESFRQVWNDSNFPVFFRNSLLVTALATVASLVVSVHAAYGLARFQFAGKTALMVGLLATSMIPGIAILVPLYNLSVHIGLYNSYAGLVLVYTAWNTPLLVWLLKGFFESVPIEMEEAALIDGCSRLRAFYTIVMPMARAGMLAGTIMGMMFVWNDFLIGFTLTITENRRLIPYGLFSFISNIGVDWGQLMAATVIALVPVIAAFLVLQKWLVQGLMAGAVKG
jgi:ABC-type glycerol-3-phosphate transport system permease component